MSVPSPVRQQIAGVVQRGGEGFKLVRHLLPVDVNPAKTFGAAPKFASVPGGDNDAAVGYHSDFYRHLRPLGDG